MPCKSHPNFFWNLLTWLNHTLAETLWPEWQFGQNDNFARVTIWPVTLWPETLWPESNFGQWLFGWWHFGQWNFDQWHFGQRHFGQFFLLPLGYQRVNKNSMWGTIDDSAPYTLLSDHNENLTVICFTKAFLDNQAHFGFLMNCNQCISISQITWVKLH